MIGLAEASVAAIAAVIVASIAAAGSVAAAVLSRRTEGKIDMGNGRSLGSTVYDVLLRAMRHERQLEQLDAKVEYVSQRLDEHLEFTEPLWANYLKDHPDLRRDG